MTWASLIGFRRLIWAGAFILAACSNAPPGPSGVPSDAANRAAACMATLATAGVDTNPPPVQFTLAIDLQNKPPSFPGCTPISITLGADGVVAHAEVVGQGDLDRGRDQAALAVAGSLRFGSPTVSDHPYGIAVDFLTPHSPISYAVVANTGVIYRWPVPEAVSNEEYAAYRKQCDDDLARLLPSSQKARMAGVATAPAARAFYPAILKRLHVQGCAVLALHLNPDGTLRAAELLSQHPQEDGLGSSALMLVKSISFVPPSDPAATLSFIATYQLH